MNWKISIYFVCYLYWSNFDCKYNNSEYNMVDGSLHRVEESRKILGFDSVEFEKRKVWKLFVYLFRVLQVTILTSLAIFYFNEVDIVTCRNGKRFLRLNLRWLKNSPWLYFYFFIYSFLPAKLQGQFCQQVSFTILLKNKAYL